MNRLSQFFRAAFTAVALLMFSACGTPLTMSSTAGLSILIADDISRTLTPSIDLVPATFTITGSGPSGATFSAVSTGGMVTKTGLVFGTWTIVINGTNAAGTLVGTGTSTVQVTTGSTTPVTVNVLPLAGVGTLGVSVSWPAALIQTPVIGATLTPALGTPQNLPFVISGATASYSNAAIGTGYYTLVLTLADATSVVAGSVEVVRIVKGQTTTGAYTYSTVNAPGGTIQVGITASPLNPLAVTVEGTTPNFTQGMTETLTASVTNYAGNVTYVWYVNGVSVATGPTYTFGANQNAGSYNVDVTAFSADGSLAGSTKTPVVIGPTAGSTWTARTMPATAAWVSVAFGNGKFVAVANAGTTAATSPDGSSWTLRTLPTSSGWTSVTFGGGIFVAVSSTGGAATSSDGVTWTASTMPAGGPYTSVTYGNGVFLAVGGSSGAATSPDGITWTARTLPNSGPWDGTSFGNGLFVVGQTGTAAAATSPDGISWTTRALPAAFNWCTSVYGNGMFVATGLQAGVVATSVDAVTWNLVTLPAAGDWRALAFGKNAFVAIAKTSALATNSSDGITWRSPALPSSATWQSMAYGNGLFVAVAMNSNKAATSP